MNDLIIPAWCSVAMLASAVGFIVVLVVMSRKSKD